jgi:hypothetical protein
MSVALIVPRRVRLLAAIYFAATLAHFSHNAEYIAFYPGMPTWLSRETVYVAWLAVTAVGAAALMLAKFRLPALALLCLGVYGALGLDGLAHYTLALCSEHTLLANITIWSEALTGLALLLTSTVLFFRRLIPPKTARG